MNNKIVIYSDDERGFISTESDGIYTRNVYQARAFDSKQQAEDYVSDNLVLGSYSFLKIVKY